MKFSIAIPAFKAKYLKECIDSILAQTYNDFELIIVNDASPEDIDSIVRPYLSYEKIQYYKNEKNFGSINVVDNWNKCLSFASGEYFLLMGDDDKLCSNCLEEYVKLIDSFPQCKVYHTRSWQINPQSEIIGITEPRPIWESVYDNIYERIKLHRAQYISDYLYETQHLKSNGGFYKLPMAWGSDDISAYRAAAVAGVAHSAKPLFCYRIHPTSLTSSGNIKIKMNAIQGEMDWLRHFMGEATQIEETDKIIAQKIKAFLPKYELNKYAKHISQAMNTHPFANLCKYWKMRKTYHLSASCYLFAINKWIINKQKKNEKMYIHNR